MLLMCRDIEKCDVHLSEIKTDVQVAGL